MLCGIQFHLFFKLQPGEESLGFGEGCGDFVVGNSKIAGVEEAKVDTSIADLGGEGLTLVDVFRVDIGQVDDWQLGGILFAVYGNDWTPS